MLLGYALFALILFIAFLAADFPYEATLSSITGPMKLRITYDSQRFSLPIGTRFEGVQIISTAQPQDQLLLQSPAITVSPTLASLLFGRPGLRIHAQVYGGAGLTTVREHASIAQVDFDFDSLDLKQVDPLRQLGAVLTGDVSLEGSAQVKGADLFANTAQAHLEGSRVTFAVVDGFPPVHLGTVTGDVNLSDGVISLNDIKAKGSDADIAANGQIRLAPNLPDSTIHLEVVLAPTQAGRDNFGLFIRMLPHPPANGPYRIEGRLFSPSIH